VAEAVNYRRKPPYNRPMLRKEGDRIVVLTDKDGDGAADDATTFYQGEDLYGPLSVLVIPTGKGLRVLVAQSPNILEFTDADGDLKADGPPKKFLTGFQGIDHDHGVHGLHLGPDGKLYFTVGDSGVKDLQSSDGKGKKWSSNTTDVQKGTVWRCDLDGKNLELIAHNFRNNYEACVDSFGEIWLSDNDDDGNQQTRICFVFPGGNYGYGPRGAGQTHWHEEQPGIVHKTLRTGFGSPTGIQFYEGSLLPKAYHNTLMHCDAGPREVRAFTRKPKGAGYELDKANILTSSDNWFRPSDVCTAPDGSVFVADWYDPGVGGHGMGDWTRGRIYRLSPKDHKGYKVPEVKLGTYAEIYDTVASPCPCVRQLAVNVVNEKYKTDAVEFQSFQQKERLANYQGSLGMHRMIWMTAANRPATYFSTKYGVFCGQPSGVESTSDLGYDYSNAFSVRNFSMTHGADVLCTPDNYARFRQTSEGSKNGPRFLAEVAIAVRNFPVEQAREILFPIMKKYDGSDIFYRAALNIACGTDPVRRDVILADFEKHFPEWNDKTADLVWELRPKSMLPKMEKLLGDAKLTGAQKARIVDILAASDDPAAGKTMLALLKSDAAAEVKAKAIENLKLFLPTKWAALKASPELKAVILALLTSGDGKAMGLTLAGASPECEVTFDVQAVAQDTSLPAAVRGQAIRVIGKMHHTQFTKMIAPFLKEPAVAADAVAALADQMTARQENAASKAALELLQGVLLGADSSAELKQVTLAALAGNRAGTGWLLKLKEDGKMPEALTADAGRLLRNSPFQGERNKAMILFPPAGKLDPKKLPAVSELAKKKGNAENGKQLMAKSLTGEAQCLKCHMITGTGGNIGPDLSMIGKKGSKENLYDSLLTPSKAIADQYVSWRLDSDDGQSVTGLLVEETPAKITVRDANGKDYTFNTKDVTKKKDAKSIMPEDVIKAFSQDELIDVVEYLMTLQTASLTPDSWNLAGPFPATEEKALDKAYDPETKPASEVKWKTLRGDSKGYFDLAAFHGKESSRTLSYMARTVDSPSDQEVTISVGTDDGCRLWVNGEKVLSHDRAEAATPNRDRVTVKLKKGANAILLKVANGDDPHGFFFTIEGGVDLKLAK
jgi:putative membrane-bound dehydrogenase-like protein